MMRAIASFSLRRPIVTLIGLSLISIILAAGLPGVKREYGYRVLIGDDHPAIETLDALVAEFSGGLPIWIAWPCGDGFPCQNVFDGPSLEMAHVVTTRLSSIAGVRSVLGPSNAPILIPDQDGFAVRRLVENGSVNSNRAELARWASVDPLWVGNVVSDDLRVGAILVQPTDNEAERSLRIFRSVQEAVADFEPLGFEFHFVGEAPSTVIGGRDLAESSASILPFTVLVIALVLFSLSRSWLHTAIALGTMGLALLWTLGLLGWLDWPRDGILEVLAPLVLVVGVCDAVHFLSRYSEELRGTNRTQTDAMLQAAQDVGAPCLVTTLTTAAAFGSFTTSALDTFVRFGAISAFGVGACFLLTFTVLPILARTLVTRRPAAREASRLWLTALDAISRSSQRRGRAILTMATVVTVFCAAGWATKLTVDTDWLESFGESSEAVRWVRFVEENFGPSDTLEIEIQFPDDRSIHEPETLRLIDDFANRIKSVDGFGHANTVVDVVKRVNRLLHADDATFERVADTPAANAQILELVGFEGPDLLGSWLSLDRSRIRISVDATSQSESGRRERMNAVKELAGRMFPDEWTTRLSGEYGISVQWVDDVQQTQLRSFPTAFTLVFVIVSIFFGSLTLGCAAMIPTLLPVVVILGAMGWVGMSLDVGRAMIAAVLIGIGVDDGIHLIHQYQINREAGLDIARSMHGALTHVGRAVVTTSVALAVGFLTLLGSAWQTIASFGFLVSLGILAALAASLFVLPAIFFAVRRRE